MQKSSLESNPAPYQRNRNVSLVFEGDLIKPVQAAIPRNLSEKSKGGLF